VVRRGPVLGVPWSPLQQKSQVLLRRNLFDGILRGYGRHGLPLIEHLLVCQTV